MKNLLFFALALAGVGLVSSCGQTKKAETAADSDSMAMDSIITIEGEWIFLDTMPPSATANQTSAPTLKLNNDNTAESVNIASTVYQAWNQQGDTLTLISQSAIDPLQQDTVNWQILTLTGDSMKIKNAKQGTKTLARKK